MNFDVSNYQVISTLCVMIANMEFDLQIFIRA